MRPRAKKLPLRTAEGSHRPSPFRSLRPRSVSPLVLVCEHASCALPAEIRAPAGARRIVRSHWGWDPGAWEVTRGLSRRTGATAVGGRWSRLLVDLNRDVRDRTLVRPAAGEIPVPWNAAIDAAEIERRILRYYAPFHHEIDRRILRLLARGSFPLVVSIHTFTPELDGRSRPFEVGILFVDDRRLAYRVGGRLRRSGLRVRYNEPYSGPDGLMYCAHHHASRHGLRCLEIELNQASVTTPRAACRLARLIAPVLSAAATGR